MEETKKELLKNEEKFQDSFGLSHKEPLESPQVRKTNATYEDLQYEIVSGTTYQMENLSTSSLHNDLIYTMVKQYKIPKTGTYKFTTTIDAQPWWWAVVYGRVYRNWTAHPDSSVTSTNLTSGSTRTEDLYFEKDDLAEYRGYTDDLWVSFRCDQFRIQYDLEISIKNNTWITILED